MPFEIERKFLVADDDWRAAVASSFSIAQHYLCADPARTVRLRLFGDRATLTIKGQAESGGLAVPEFEYAIPADDARALLPLCLPGGIVKTRHIVPWAGKRWEVDVFEGANAGLVLAELELTSENETFDPPAWLGAEVTQDPRYKNAALATHPCTAWAETVTR